MKNFLLSWGLPKFKTGRRHSTTRSASDAEVEDIIRIFDVLDNQNDLHKVQFGAINMDRMPKYGREEINICTVVDRQIYNHLDAKVSEMASQVSSPVSSIESLRGLNVSSVAGAAAAAAPPSVSASNSIMNSAPPLDRTRNVVIVVTRVPGAIRVSRQVGGG